MSDDEPDSLVLRYMRSMSVDPMQSKENHREAKQRMTALRDGLTGVRRELVDLHEAQTRVQHTPDRPGEGLERIERRLDLMPA